MKVKTLYSIALCLLLMAATSCCFKQTKPIEQMTNSELLEEYQRLELEILFPRETSVMRSTGIPFDTEVVIKETSEEYRKRMYSEQRKVEQELNNRNLSPEEQRQFDSIMAPVYEIIPLPPDSLSNIEEYSNSEAY